MRVISKVRKELFEKKLKDWLNDIDRAKTTAHLREEFPEWKHYLPLIISESKYEDRVWECHTDGNETLWTLIEPGKVK
jgi:hypothetical protein